MDDLQSDEEWAGEEFGLARLGDKRRVKRLVMVAASAANQPAGEVTSVFCDSAAREGAYRLMENEAVSVAEVAQAAHQACARRAAASSFAFVPIDGSSLNLTDHLLKKGLGAVGARFVGARGLQVMTALALSPKGVPLGLCGQTFWTRKQRARRHKRKHDRRPVGQKETKHWLRVMHQVRKVFASEAPQTKPWFQLVRRRHHIDNVGGIEGARQDAHGAPVKEDGALGDERAHAPARQPGELRERVIEASARFGRAGEVTDDARPGLSQAEPPAVVSCARACRRRPT
jgi:hypothetical protein